MDELKTVEAYTRELEALRNYDLIKKERDELAEKCSKLETRVSELKGEIASLKEFKIEFVGKDLTLEQAKAKFEEMVEREGAARAEMELKQLINVEWPSWYAGNVKPRLSDLEAKIKENAIGLLRGPWQIRCEKCGIEGRFELTEQNIRGLLYWGDVLVVCSNPNCKDYRSGKHKTKVSFQDLIAWYIQGPRVR